MGVEVICPYMSYCTSYPHKCDKCVHNLIVKRDYFKPRGVEESAHLTQAQQR